MTPDELSELWRRLVPPAVSEQLDARLLPGTGDAWAAIDHQGRRHLLLEVETGAALDVEPTKGMEVSVARHQVAGQAASDYLDLVCLDEAVAPTFCAVAAELGNIAAATARINRPAAVREALANWQWFWDIAADRLSDSDALGLFGELWFLHRWIGSTERGLDGWTGSDGSRHDFQWPEYSVEVKATAKRGDAGAVHRVAHLDQLAPPETGDLYLFSLRVAPDRLAANSLPLIVDEIASALRTLPLAEREFRSKLGQRGFNPALGRRHDTTYRVLEERIYRVVDGFPRLTAESFGGGPPDGIDNVSYSLSMEACAHWLVAQHPTEWHP